MPPHKKSKQPKGKVSISLGPSRTLRSSKSKKAEQLQPKESGTELLMEHSMAAGSSAMTAHQDDFRQKTESSESQEHNEPLPERESDSTLSPSGYKDDATALQAKITGVEKKLKKCLLYLKMTFGIEASDSTILLELCYKKAAEYHTEIQKLEQLEATDTNLKARLQYKDELYSFTSITEEVQKLYEKKKEYIAISNSIPPPCPSAIANYHAFFSAVLCKLHHLNTLQFHAVRKEKETVEYLAPVTLVCNAFAKYLHLFASEDIKRVQSRYWRTALRMIEALNCHNVNEDALRKRLEDCLQVEDIFSGFSLQRISVAQKYQTDLSLCSRGISDKHCMANFELKLTLCGTNSCPELENIAYFYNMETYFMFCIVICGWSYFQVFGAARLKNDDDVIKTIVMPLGAPFSLRYFPEFGDDDILLAKSLYALDSSSGEWQDIVLRHASVPRLLDVLPRLDGIKYKERLFSSKLLFTAETETDDGVKKKVIKFVLNYGIDVHRCLSTEGFAPTADLVKCNDLWSAVVMDSFDGEVLSKFMSSGCGDDIKTYISTQLDSILKSLHHSEFVHGDLRSENIIITKSNKVQVIGRKRRTCLLPTICQSRNLSTRRWNWQFLNLPST